MSNVPGILALVGCSLLLLAFLPRFGVYWWWQRYRALQRRVLIEDALKHFHQSEAVGLAVTVDSLSGALQVSRGRSAGLVERLDSMSLVEPAGLQWELSSEGRQYALRIVRAHRLLEVYLAERTGLPETQWHGAADRREHLLSSEEVNALAAEMGYPRYDPHGDPIPLSSGEVAPARGVPLTTLASGQSATVVHVEDEPEVVYQQLTAQGFSLGTQLAVLESTPQRIRVEVHGEEQTLAPLLAANLSVAPRDKSVPREKPLKRLAEIPPGESAWVVRVSPACRGVQRRRLFDLGLIPGTLVRAEFCGPGGDPTAYDIRGATIALRRQQAEQILVTSEQPQPTETAIASSSSA